MRLVLPVNHWTTADARAWSQRLPRVARLAAAPAVLAVGVGFSIAMSESGVDAATATSAANALYSLAQGLLVAALLVCWLVPRGGALTGLVAAVALAVEPAEAAHTSWAWVAAALALLAGADGLALVRQRLVAETWSGGPQLVPDPDPVVAARARRTTVQRQLVAGALAVVAVGGALLFWHDDHEVRAFRARAQTIDGTVVSVDENLTSAEVDLGARTVRVPVVDVPSVGAAVRVTTDGARAELVDEAFDPTGALLLVVIGAVGAGWVLAAERFRRARVERLLAGAAGLEVLLVAHEEDRLLLAPVDDLRAFLTVRVLAPPAADPDAGPDAGDGSGLDLDLDDQALLEQARRALARRATEGTSRRARLASGPTWPIGSRLTLVGLVDDVSPVALRGPDGTWAIAPAPVRGAPRRVPVRAEPGADGAGTAVGSAAGAAPAQAPGRAVAGGDAAATPPARRAPGRFLRLAATTGRWGPFAALPLPAVLGWLVGQAHNLRVVLLVWGAWALASAWTRAAVPWLEPGPGHLVVTGTWRDTLVPWGLLTAVTATDDHLMVRWGRVSPDPATGSERDDRAVVVLDGPAGSLPALTPDGLDAAGAAAALEAARLAPGSGDERVRYRVGRPALAGLAWTAALVACVVLAW